MQDLCNYIASWCFKWRIVVNCDRNKTELIVVFPSKRIKNKNSSLQTIYLGQHRL